MTGVLIITGVPDLGGLRPRPNSIQLRTQEIARQYIIIIYCTYVIIINYPYMYICTHQRLCITMTRAVVAIACSAVHVVTGVMLSAQLDKTTLQLL